MWYSLKMSAHSSGEGSPSLSFRELAQREEVAGPDVLSCFMGYAIEGWAIDASTVILLSERASLSTIQYHTLAAVALEGVKTQIAGGKFGSKPETSQREAQEYMGVLGYAGTKLEEIAALN